MKAFITKIDSYPYADAETPFKTDYVISDAEEVRKIRKANPGKYDKSTDAEVVNYHMWLGACEDCHSRCKTVETELEQRGYYDQELLAEAFEKAAPEPAEFE